MKRSEIDERFAALVHRKRKERRLSQTKLAELSGLTRAAIMDIELRVKPAVVNEFLELMGPLEISDAEVLELFELRAA